MAELVWQAAVRSRKARDDAFEQYRKDASKVNDYIDKHRDYNDVVQEYRNALIEHRQNMLSLTRRSAPASCPEPDGSKGPAQESPRWARTTDPCDAGPGRGWSPGGAGFTLGPRAASAPALQVSASQKRFTPGFFGRYVAAPGDVGIGERIFARGQRLSLQRFLQGSTPAPRVATPSDPSGEVTGTASLYDQNYTSTGNLLALDLAGSVGPDGHVHDLSWTVDEHSSGHVCARRRAGHAPPRRPDPPPDALCGAASGPVGVKFRGAAPTDPADNPLLLP